MKTRPVLILILALLGFKTPAAGTVTNYQHHVMPLISMDEVPLRDGIRALARQDGINFIFDPVVLDSFAGPNGRFSREPHINSRWTNVTAQQALDDVLKTYRLTMVTNPVTSVARIAFTEQRVEPAPASQLGTDTTAVIPLIVMTEVPQIDGIKNLARKADLPYILDPTLNSATTPSGQEALLASRVNIRWENITPKQALVALLDDYGLAMVQGPGDAAVRIIAKPQSGPLPRGNHGGGQPKNKTVISAGAAPRPGLSPQDYCS
jgi:hypothetical protein